MVAGHIYKTEFYLRALAHAEPPGTRPAVGSSILSMSQGAIRHSVHPSKHRDTNSYNTP